jgi:hypothetical protein
MDLPTVRNNLDVELQMQLNAQLVEASSCPDKRKKTNIIEAWFFLAKRINPRKNRASNGIMNCLPAYFMVSSVIDEQNVPSGEQISSKNAC